MNINDIAREAGVSTATVSRVLNNLPVREENRLRVEEAIQKLDYMPNPFARGLMNKQSQAIGVLIASMSNSYYMEITDAIERRLRERELMLFLCSTDNDVETEKRYLKELLARSVDGIIVLDASNENYASGLFKGIAQKVPVVLVHSNPDIHDLDSVVIDQALGMRKVMEQLWRLGHRKVGFLRGREGIPYEVKEKAWRDFLAVHGQDPAAESLIVIEQGNTSEAISQAEEACLKILDSESRPSAIFACNDMMARGVVNAASRLGLRIPEQLSVVGHDNTILALSGRTQLSSVDLKMKSLGNAAVDLLYRHFDGGDPEPRRVFIVPEMVLRESTGPCAQP